jgi:hypothetical protein
MRIVRNNLAYCPWRDQVLAITQRGDDGVAAQRFTPGGAPIGGTFRISDEPGYCAWVMVAAADDATDPRWAVTYIVGDLGENWRVIREVRAGVFDGVTVSPARRLVPTYGESNYSDRGGIVWTPAGWIVSVRLPPPDGAAFPEAAVVRVAHPLAAFPVTIRTLAGSEDNRNAPALAYDPGLDTVVGVGYAAGADEGYRGGTWATQIDPATLTVRTPALRLDVDRCEDHAIVALGSGVFLAQWTAVGAGVRRALTVTPGPLDPWRLVPAIAYEGRHAQALAFHEPVGVALAVGKDAAADLVARQMAPDGEILDPGDDLRIVTWDGLIQDYHASIVAVPAGFLVSADRAPQAGGAVLVLVKTAPGAKLHDLNVPAPPRPVDPPPVDPPLTLPDLVPAGRAIFVGHWDTSSGPHPDVPPNGATYGYHVAPGNFDVICRSADLSQRLTKGLPFLVNRDVAPQVTAADDCRGVMLHRGADEPNTDGKLEATRAQADRLRVPVWIYVDKGEPWDDWQRAALRPGDVPMLQMYRGADDRAGTAASFRRLRDQFAGWPAVCIVRRNYRGGVDAGVPLAAILESHEDLSVLVRESPNVIADTAFCWAPAARGGPLHYPVLAAVAARVAAGSTGIPTFGTPAPAGPVEDLLLLVSPAADVSGPAPHRIGFSVHDRTAGDALVPGATVVLAWEGATPATAAAGPDGRGGTTLGIPGVWKLRARHAGRVSPELSITVTRATSTRKPSKLKFCG